MSSNLDSVRVERPVLDIGLGELLHSALTSLWRRRLIMAAIIASAVALGIIAILVIPPRYTPTAFIRGGFVVSNAVASDEGNKSAYVGLDLTRMIETQSRLLESQDLARRVVQQLGLEQLQPELTKRLPDQADQEDPIDRAAMTLLGRLSVTTDLLRTYMIKVSYTSHDPTLAVAVTNAFAAEFLRSSNIQMLTQQRSAAEAALTKELVKFGDKHPRVMQAKVRLATLDELIKKRLSEAPAVLLQAAGEKVTKATATTLTLSPNPPFVIGLLLAIGLMAAVAVALYLERNKWTDTFSHYIQPFA
jgi:uncharacterized protein involved in exopolysaccharide biosynthesis